MLGGDRIKLIANFPLPKTPKQLRGLLSLMRFCQVWISECESLARPLYELARDTRLAGCHFLVWSTETLQAFTQLKRALLESPALALPTGKIFNLYVFEKKGVVLGVLTQPRGLAQQPVGYFSKQLGSVVRDWPACLRAVAAIALLIPKAARVTSGQDLVVHLPRNISDLLSSKGGPWLADNSLLKYLTLLLERPVVRVKTCSSPHPAAFLPEVMQAPEHESERVILQGQGGPSGSSARRSRLGSLCGWELLCGARSPLGWVCRSYFGRHC